MALVAPDYNQILKGAQAQQAAAGSPLIFALEAQRQPIADRYAGIIADIKSNQESALSGQQTVTSREFGARGIPLSSGVFGQTVEEKLNPIRRQYSGLLSQTGAERETSLGNLATQIAQMKAGFNQSALQMAQNMYSQKYTEYKDVLARQRQAQLDKEAVAIERAKLGAGGGGGTTTAGERILTNYKSQLINALNTGQLKATTSPGQGGGAFEKAVAAYSGILSLGDILNAYMQSSYGKKYGKPAENLVGLQKQYYGGSTSKWDTL